MSQVKLTEELHKLVDLIDQYYVKKTKQTVIPTDKNIAVLKDAFDFSLDEEGVSDNKLFSLLKDYLTSTIKTDHPQYLNNLYGGVDLPGVLAEMVTSVTNVSMTQYENSAIPLLMEKELVDTLNHMVGFDKGEGIMVSGGSEANTIAMLCARNRQLPTAKQQGLDASQLVGFVSDQAHFSLFKTANLIGIGEKNLIKVPTFKDRTMDPEALKISIEDAIQKKKTPFFIACTSGTSASGAFDPIEEIAKVANYYNLWLHIDAAWGGAVLFSKKYRHLIRGSERADSFSLDAHKLMGTPLVCSLILVKQRGTLKQNCTIETGEYLNDDGNTFDYCNPLQMSLACTRRTDSLKLWLSLKYFGKSHYENRINYLFDLASYAVNQIKQHDNLELLEEPKYLNVCFRYIDAGLEESVLDDINLNIRQKLFHSGKSMVNYVRYDRGLYLRLVIRNAMLSTSDLDNFFHNTVNIGYEVAKNYL